MRSRRFFVGLVAIALMFAVTAPEAGASTPRTPAWVARYNGLANGNDRASSVAVSPDGTKVFVTGLSDGISTSVDYATIAYDAAVGTELWVGRYNGPGNSADAAYGLAMSPDGTKVFVTGDSQGSTADFATVAYSVP